LPTNSKPKSVENYLSIARQAAVEVHGEVAVGDLLGTLQEEHDGVLTFLFASKLKGYPDWSVNVTMFIDGPDATVSEVVLAPSETSLVAPKWVPWSERLADYKALQAAMEAEAAAAALEAEENDEELEEEEDLDEVEGDATELAAQAANEPTDPAAAVSAVSDVPESPESQDDADATRGKSKGFFKWKTLRGGKKRK
jgi:hypothetical protein